MQSHGGMPSAAKCKPQGDLKHDHCIGSLRSMSCQGVLPAIKRTTHFHTICATHAFIKNNRIANHLSLLQMSVTVTVTSPVAIACCQCMSLASVGYVQDVVVQRSTCCDECTG